MPESKPPKKTITTEIMELDAQLARLLEKRSWLLSKAVSSRTAKKKASADPEQERRLWAAFERAGRELNMDTGHLRKLFTLMNSLAYARASGRGSQESHFVLTPPQGQVRVEAAAPVDQKLARMVLAAATAGGAPCEAGPVMASDPVADLVKTLNQAGGKLYRDGEFVAAREGAVPAFENASIYVGHDRLNLFLAVAMALGHPGRCRFTGGPDLKLADLSPLARLLPMLGARFTSVTPGSKGLPVRMEAGERMATEPTLPEDCPGDFAAALALMAWTYPEGLTLRFSPDSEAARGARTASAALAALGVSFESGEDFISVPQQEPVLARRPALPLEPLALAVTGLGTRIRAGEVRLSGRLGETPAALAVRDLLLAAGMNLDESGGNLTVTPGAWPDPLVLSPSDADTVPLAVALAGACPTRGRVALAEDETRTGAFLDLLAACGVPAQLDADGSLIAAAGEARPTRDPWSAPDAPSVLGAALLSLAKPGLKLANPGVAGDLWPGFWKIFNRMGTPLTSLMPVKEIPDDEPEPTRRRIRIG